MLYAQNHDLLGCVINVVKDTIIADPQAIKPLPALEFETIARPGRLPQNAQVL